MILEEGFEKLRFFIILKLEQKTEPQLSPLFEDSGTTPNHETFYPSTGQKHYKKCYG